MRLLTLPVGRGCVLLPYPGAGLPARARILGAREAGRADVKGLASNGVILAALNFWEWIAFSVIIG